MDDVASGFTTSSWSSRRRCSRVYVGQLDHVQSPAASRVSGKAPIRCREQSLPQWNNSRNIHIPFTTPLASWRTGKSNSPCAPPKHLLTRGCAVQLEPHHLHHLHRRLQRGSLVPLPQRRHPNRMAIDSDIKRMELLVDVGYVSSPSGSGSREYSRKGRNVLWSYGQTQAATLLFRCGSRHGYWNISAYNEYSHHLLGPMAPPHRA